MSLYQMEREVGSCSLFAARKPNKFVLIFSILLRSPFNTVVPLFGFAVVAAGAEPALGAPSTGALSK